MEGTLELVIPQLLFIAVYQVREAVEILIDIPGWIVATARFLHVELPFFKETHVRCHCWVVVPV